VTSFIHLLRTIFPKHLSDRDLTLLIGDELPLLKRHDAEVHLRGCTRCSHRYEALNAASDAVAAYCEEFAEADGSSIRNRRNLLLVRLNRLFRDAALASRPIKRKPQFPGISLPTMNPTLATARVLVIASVACISLWMQQSKPDITSNALLVRAQAWDAPSSHANAGVIYQKVAIRTSHQRVYRAIYRDAHGEKKPRLQPLSYEDEQLKSRLSAAGVSWDAPLSAANYQDWHDRQRVRQDKIVRTGKNLLVLTTTVPDGAISQQSFTVRDSDFHPVERSVLFRNHQTIEIAEVEYDILPWSQVDANLFEPPTSPSTDRVVSLQPALVPKMPALLTEEQLDESESSARLVLNQFHADTGEQIKLEREPQGIEIKGLVETDERKSQLQKELRYIPHATVAILSLEELNRNPASQPASSNVEVASAAAQPTPLESSFLKQGRGSASLSDLSQQLVDSALTIDRESHAITDLKVRFGSAEKMTDLASATLSELMFSHRERLFSALETEQRLLDQARGTSTSSPKLFGTSGKQAIPLVTAAGKNLALCKELTLGGGTPSRSADAILSDLQSATNDVRSSAHQTRLGTVSSAAASGKK
jgi:hypothetical protein